MSELSFFCSLEQEFSNITVCHLLLGEMTLDAYILYKYIHIYTFDVLWIRECVKYDFITWVKFGDSERQINYSLHWYSYTIQGISQKGIQSCDVSLRASLKCFVPNCNTSLTPNNQSFFKNKNKIPSYFRQWCQCIRTKTATQIMFIYLFDFHKNGLQISI